MFDVIFFELLQRSLCILPFLTSSQSSVLVLSHIKGLQRRWICLYNHLYKVVNGTRIQYSLNTKQGTVVSTWAGVCLVLWFDAKVLFQSVHVQSCHQFCYQGHTLDFNLPYLQCCFKLKLFLAQYLQNHSITCMFVVAKHGRIRCSI